MSKRFTVFLSDEEHAGLVARATYLNLSMSQVVGNAIKAVVYGNLDIVGERIVIRQASGEERTFQLQRLTPTPVSRETPVPDAAIGAGLLGEISLADARRLNVTHPGVYAEIDEGKLIDAATGVIVGRIKK